MLTLCVNGAVVLSGSKLKEMVAYLIGFGCVSVSQLDYSMKQGTQLTVNQRREFSLYELLQILVVFGLEDLGEMVKNLVKSNIFTQIVVDFV